MFHSYRDFHFPFLESGVEANKNKIAAVTAVTDNSVFRRRRPIRIARARSTVEPGSGGGGSGGGGLGALKNWSSTTGHPVHRAPSRLYKLNDQQLQKQQVQQLQHPSSDPSMSTSTGRLRRKSFSALFDVAPRPSRQVVDREPDSCCGPEFIVKNSLPPHLITLGHQPKKVRLTL